MEVKTKTEEFSSAVERLNVYSKIVLSEIDTLIDIGVSDGRFIESVKDLFPNLVQIIGIDPISEYSNKAGFQYFEGAIGYECKPIDYHISEDLFTSSKLYEGVRRVTVNQYRLECVLRQLKVETNAKIFLKTDTQGMDIECLLSAGEYLGSIQMALLEIQMRPFVKEMSYFSQSIKTLDENGFEICEFTSPIYRQLDGALGQIDLIVAPKNSKIFWQNSW